MAIRCKLGIHCFHYIKELSRGKPPKKHDQMDGRDLVKKLWKCCRCPKEWIESWVEKYEFVD